MGPPRPGPLPPSTSATHEYRLDRATNKNDHSHDPQRRRAVADIRSEPRPASDRNRWPASYWNAWPASSESPPRPGQPTHARVRIIESRWWTEQEVTAALDRTCR